MVVAVIEIIIHQMNIFLVLIKFQSSNKLPQPHTQNKLTRFNNLLLYSIPYENFKRLMNNTKKASAGIFDRNDNHSRLDSRASSTVFSEQSSHVSSRVSSRASNSSHVSSTSTIRNSGKF